MVKRSSGDAYISSGIVACCMLQTDVILHMAEKTGECQQIYKYPYISYVSRFSLSLAAVFNNHCSPSGRQYASKNLILQIPSQFACQ
ncbi:hypothetical protein Cni_G05561 [Canna indica]|uniref:Uncharacterized protein n=1 Tax=Canna indica TaxID=4628 RepID=A0AAQ3JWU5_9LILI|nr:hypothetical protein Cni_G05561 [Canna indica]